MGRGAEGDDRFAGREEIEHVLKRLLIGAAKAEKEDHQIGVGEFLGSGEGFGGVGIDEAVLVDGESHRYIKVKIPSQDAGEHGHRLLGAVFLVAGEEYDFEFFLSEDGRRRHEANEDQGKGFGHGFQRAEDRRRRAGAMGWQGWVTDVNAEAVETDQTSQSAFYPNCRMLTPGARAGLALELNLAVAPDGVS